MMSMNNHQQCKRCVVINESKMETEAIDVERINTLSASASVSESALVISLGTESMDTERSSIVNDGT